MKRYFPIAGLYALGVGMILQLASVVLNQKTVLAQGCGGNCWTNQSCAFNGVGCQKCDGTCPGGPGSGKKTCLCGS